MNDFILAMIRGLMEAQQIEKIVVGRLLYKQFKDYANSKEIEISKIFDVPIIRNKELEPYNIHIHQQQGGILKADLAS